MFIRATQKHTQCIHASMPVYLYAQLYVGISTYVRIYVSASEGLNVCTYVYVYVYVHVHVHVCIYIYTHVCVSMYVRTYVRMYVCVGAGQLQRGHTHHKHAFGGMLSMVYCRFSHHPTQW